MGGGKVRERRRLHRAASGRRGHRGRRGVERFGRYPEVPGLVEAPHRCREVPFTSQKHKFVGRAYLGESRAGVGMS